MDADVVVLGVVVLLHRLVIHAVEMVAKVLSEVLLRL